MNMPDIAGGTSSLPVATPSAPRRRLLSRLLTLPLLPVVLGAWPRASSEIVIIRDGWVLSKDD